MPEPYWWAFRAFELVALSTSVVLAVLASRKAGGHTPYGTFLFTMAVGFWFLLSGFLLHNSRRMFDVKVPPGALSDVLSFTGWAILDLAFALFVIRFARARVSTRQAPWMVVARHAALPLILVLVLFAILIPPGFGIDDRAYQVRLAYVVVDGIGLGLIVASVRNLIRFQESALGRLYLILGVGLAFKSAGDLMWVYAADRDVELFRVIASGFYPLAGIAATVALSLHYVIMARSRDSPADFSDPALTTPHRVFRDVHRAMCDLVGEFGGGVVTRSAIHAFARRGVDAKVGDSGLEVSASVDDWLAVLAEVRDNLVDAMGTGARTSLAAIGAAYGPDYEFLGGTAAHERLAQDGGAAA